MPSSKSRRRATHRRCKRCGRFLGKAEVKLCSSCLAVASIDEESDASDASGDGSGTTDYGRTLADLGLDVRFLSQDISGSEASRPTIKRTVDTPSPVGPPALPPPLHALREALLMHAQRDSIIASSTRPQSRPAPRVADGSKSVLTFIGPVAAAQRASDRSREGWARRLWPGARAAARPIAITQRSS